MTRPKRVLLLPFPRGRHGAAAADAQYRRRRMAAALLLALALGLLCVSCCGGREAVSARVDKSGSARAHNAQLLLEALGGRNTERAVPRSLRNMSESVHPKEYWGSAGIVCQPIPAWSSCSSCILADLNNTWCSKHDQCFSTTNTTNKKACKNGCSGDLVSSLNDCDQAQVDVVAVVFSFVLLVMCPLCVISGCIYVVAFRCRGSSKVHIAPDGPIPVLHVATSLSQGTLAQVADPEMAEVELLSGPQGELPITSVAVPVSFVTSGASPWGRGTYSSVAVSAAPVPACGSSAVQVPISQPVIVSQSSQARYAV